MEDLPSDETEWWIDSTPYPGPYIEGYRMSGGAFAISKLDRQFTDMKQVRDLNLEKGDSFIWEYGGKEYNGIVSNIETGMTGRAQITVSFKDYKETELPCRPWQLD